LLTIDVRDHRKVIRGHGEKGKQHDVKLEALQNPTILANDGWQKHACHGHTHCVPTMCNNAKSTRNGMKLLTKTMLPNLQVAKMHK
jgi:hypothetical protein